VHRASGRAGARAPPTDQRLLGDSLDLLARHVQELAGRQPERLREPEGARGRAADGRARSVTNQWGTMGARSAQEPYREMRTCATLDTVTDTPTLVYTSGLTMSSVMTVRSRLVEEMR